MCGSHLRVLACLFLFAFAPPASAQGYHSASQTDLVSAAYSEAQLDQMLAPIALYSDPLIEQVLEASTYPLDVVDAYSWLQDPYHANLRDGALDAALDGLPWDSSVKALVSAPQVLRLLNDNIEWMEALGKAYLSQQESVLASVQRLRHMAFAAGTLIPTPQQAVFREGSYIIIQPVAADVIYVPYYNPSFVYGVWPYRHHPPRVFVHTRVINRPVIVFKSSIKVVKHFHVSRHHFDRDHNRSRSVREHRYDRARQPERVAIHSQPAAKSLPESKPVPVMRVDALHSSRTGNTRPNRNETVTQIVPPKPAAAAPAEFQRRERHANPALLRDLKRVHAPTRHGYPEIGEMRREQRFQQASERREQRQQAPVERPAFSGSSVQQQGVEAPPPAVSHDRGRDHQRHSPRDRNGHRSDDRETEKRRERN